MENLYNDFWHLINKRYLSQTQFYPLFEKFLLAFALGPVSAYLYEYTRLLLVHSTKLEPEKKIIVLSPDGLHITTNEYKNSEIGLNQPIEFFVMSTNEREFTIHKYQKLKVGPTLKTFDLPDQSQLSHSHLKYFFKFLGIKYSCQKVGPLCYIIQLHHVDKEGLYKIPPRIIPSTPQNDLYHAYVNQERTDFKLSSMDDYQFNVHASVFNTNGGEYFESLLSGKFKKLDCTQLMFSHQSVALYIDYVYLGEFVLVRSDIDLIEMYRLALYVSNKNLTDSILNQLSFYATTKDVKALTQLNEMYPSCYLQELIDAINNLYIEKPIMSGDLSFEVSDKDVELVMSHVNSTLSQAILSLINNRGDIVEAVMQLQF